MKKSAVGTLVKDLLILVVWGGIMAVCIFTGNSLEPGAAIFGWLVMTGIPFGWRWASKIITAVSFRGIALKAVIAAALGIVALFVVVVADLIRFLVMLLSRKKSYAVANG